MAKATEKRIEEFAESVANAGPKAGVFKLNGNFAYAHCPFPGPDNDPHQANGEPGVSIWLDTAGDVLAHCRKCLGPKDAYGDPAALAEARREYTDRLKELSGWDREPLKKRKIERIRTHVYFDRDLKHHILKDKVKEDGVFKFWWRKAALNPDMTRAEEPRATRAEEFLSENYPDYGDIYRALNWYGLETLAAEEVAVSQHGEPLMLGSIHLRRPISVVITEGEKDADTFNALMAETGNGVFATCLSHPKPGALSAHHLPLLKGARVSIIPDHDTAGKEQGEHWLRMIWDLASERKVVHLPGLTGAKDDKDLSDWVAKRGGVSRAVADELLGLIVAAPYAVDRPPVVDESIMTIGVQAAFSYYKPAYREGADGFFSESMDTLIKLPSFNAPRIILDAIERAKEVARDQHGDPKPGAANAAWKNWKGQIFAEVLAQLQPKSKAKVTEAAAAEFGRLLTNLLSSMVDVTMDGAFIGRHSIGSWARAVAERYPGRWRRLQSYALWACVGPRGLQLGIKPELATQTQRLHSELAKMTLISMRMSCITYGFASEHDNDTRNSRIFDGVEQKRVVILDSIFVESLSLSNCCLNEQDERLREFSERSGGDSKGKGKRPTH